MILLIIAITVFLILACGCVRTFLILTHRDIAKVNQKLYYILHKLRLYVFIYQLYLYQSTTRSSVRRILKRGGGLF